MTVTKRNGKTVKFDKKKISKAQSGDKEALNEIVKDNYGLVYSIAKRFENIHPSMG